MINETTPADPETGEILGDIISGITEGGPGVKPPPKRSPPANDDDVGTNGGPGVKPPPK